MKVIKEVLNDHVLWLFILWLSASLIGAIANMKTHYITDTVVAVLLTILSGFLMGKIGNKIDNKNGTEHSE